MFDEPSSDQYFAEWYANREGGATLEYLYQIQMDDKFKYGVFKNC